MCDDHSYPNFRNITHIPKFAIGGDLHAFTKEDASQRQDMAEWSTYVLSTCAFGNRERTPYPYHWPPQSTFDKLLFFPHHVSDDPVAVSFPHEHNAGLGGNCSPVVYPFRALCEKFPEVTRIPYLQKKHGEFLTELSRYRVGITCNSIIGYNLAKYFEIPWAGSLLFAERPCAQEMAFLGYDEKSAVLIPKEKARDAAHIRGRLIEVLNNWSGHFENVAKEGQEIVRKRHRVRIRFEYIAELVDRIRRGGFRPDDQFAAFEDAVMAASEPKDQ